MLESFDALCQSLCATTHELSHVRREFDLARAVTWKTVRLLTDHHFGPSFKQVVHFADICVEQSDAASRLGVTDRIWFDGPVDAVAVSQVEPVGSERILGIASGKDFAIGIGVLRAGDLVEHLEFPGGSRIVFADAARIAADVLAAEMQRQFEVAERHDRTKRAVDDFQFLTFAQAFGISAIESREILPRDVMLAGDLAKLVAGLHDVRLLEVRLR